MGAGASFIINFKGAEPQAAVQPLTKKKKKKKKKKSLLK